MIATEALVSTLPTPDEVLDFWIGPVDDQGQVDRRHRERWFMKSPQLDDFIRERFGALHTRVARGELDDWLATAHGRLAYLIVLDQFSRNIYRDQPQAFAFDELALEAALAGIDRGDDLAVPEGARAFFYLPLMHSEALDMQQQAIALYRAWGDEEGMRYAAMHRDIIQRFGRFPHRNAILGRTSTDEERAFLLEPGSSF